MENNDACSDAIIGPQYCIPGHTDLAFAKKVAGVKDGRLAVTDVSGNVIFKLQGSSWTLDNKKLLVDAASGRPIVSIKEKFKNGHRQWHVFRGDSNDSKDLLFSVKRSSGNQITTVELNVFLAANKKEDVCDFKIKGKYSDMSCVIYKGNTSAVLAQMSRAHKIVNVNLGKDAFGVTVNPNADYAFIASLFVVVGKLYNEANAINAAVEWAEEVVEMALDS